MREVSKHYADIPFNTLAENLDIPVQDIPDILAKAIDASIVVGKIDRINNCLIVRDIPASFTEQLVTGQVTTVNQVEQTYSQPINTAFGFIQKELPSNQYVLTRQDLIVRIKEVVVSCQVCSTSSTTDKFLKCEQCSRDLCWDHFEELGSVGRPCCPFCDGSLVFLPQFCEKCHIDYIQVPKDKNVCEFCGYPLTVKNHLIESYKSFLTTQRSPVQPLKTNDSISNDFKSKK